MMNHSITPVRARQSALLVLSCTLLLASGCSDRRSEQYRGQGDIEFSNGNFDKAREFYLKSEETNPDNPWAQVGFARCAAKDGKIEEALSRYESARGLNPTLPEPYKEAVFLLVESDRVDDALKLGDAFATVDPVKGGLLHAAVLLKGGRAGDAVLELEKLHETYPDQSDVQFNLGVAYAEAGKPEDAAIQLKDLAQGNSKLAPTARMALIEVYESQGKINEAVTEFEAASEARPTDTNVKLGYARALLLAGRADDAEAIAKGVLENEPTSGWANYILGAVKLDQGERDQAVEFLAEAATALPDEAAVARLLTQAQTGEAPVQQATGPLAEPGSGPQTWKDLWKQAALMRLLSNRDSYIAEGGDEARETIVLAAVFSQNVSLAIEIAAALPEDSKVKGFLTAMESRNAKTIGDYFAGWNPQEPEQLLRRDNALGYALASGGSRGQALSLFLFSLERWPDNVVALYNIAQIFRALRQPVMAAQQFQRLIVQYPQNIDAHQLLYAALREGGAFDAARKAAEASYALFPEERWSFLYLAQAYSDTGDPELALQVLNRAAGMFPGDPEFESVRGGIFVRLGDCDEARKVLNAIASTAPAILGNRANLLAICEAISGGWDKIPAIVATADSAYMPDSLRVLSFVSLLKAGDPEAARAALIAGGSDTPVAGKLGLILTSASGSAVEGLSEEEQAWASTLSGDATLLEAYCVVSSLQFSRLFDASWNYYETHLAGVSPHIALAQLAFSALQHADSVEGVDEKALAIAEKLAADPRVWLGLAELRNAKGDAPGEAEAVQKALAAGPDNPEAWSRNAGLLEKEQDYSGAAESYRKLTALVPDNAAANNNLAYMLLKSGENNEEALERATLASEQRPGNPGILHTLGLAQFSTGDFVASKKTLTMASELDPANPTISYDYGRVLFQLGDKEKAKERVRYALGMSQRAGLDFPERAEAETLLAEMDQ